MDPFSLHAFLDELEKIAAVPKAVKMYRRSLAGLEAAKRSVRGMSDVPAAGFALHGTEHVPEILESKRLIASSLGEHGQHGGGVYWWRGYPREHYLSGPEAEGVLTDLETLPNKRRMMPNIYTGHANPQAVRSGPEDYKLRPKDYAVVDTATRTKDKTLGPVMADAMENRTRVIDSAIFNRAMRDFKNSNLRASGREASGPAATPAELVGLLARRRQGQP